MSALKEVVKRFKKSENVDFDLVVRFLQHYGYVSTNYSLEEFENALAVFKEAAGIKEDGIGDKSFRLMNLPRCGCKDVALLRANAAQVNKWGLKTITYFIKGRDSDLSVSDWDLALYKALQSWSEVCDLKFERVENENQANLVYNVGSGKRYGFDGPSGTLAWAYLAPAPNYKGQLECYFDSSETWKVSASVRGIFLENVACHETGHLLGFEHSRIESALMAPYYNANIAKPQENDDIKRAVAYYGKPVIVTPTPTPTPTDTTKLTINLEIKGELTNVQIPGYRVFKQSTTS